VSQPLRRHQVTAALKMDSSRLTVFGSTSTARATNATVSTSGTPGASKAANGISGGVALRRSRPSGDWSPVMSHAQVVSEIR
jgi:hypothetical protein